MSTVARFARIIEEMKIEEKMFSDIPFKNLNVIQDIAVGFDVHTRQVTLLHSDRPVPYDKVCIATGGKPKKLYIDAPADAVLTLRDSHSVDMLKKRLENAKKVVIVGNGGIALELACALKGLHLIWVVRQGHIGDAFFDADAARFFLEELSLLQQGAVEVSGNSSRDTINAKQQPAIRSSRVGQSTNTADTAPLGHAVGYFWTKSLQESQSSSSRVTIEMHSEIKSVRAQEGDAERVWTVELTDGSVHTQVDLVISAIGVNPCVGWVPAQVVRNTSDGGISVNRNMETSIPGVYAAGDACTITDLDDGTAWFQMRLWSQARLQGVHAAHCMAGVSEQTASDMAFELFTHATHFLGKKVILLGRYNGQGLDQSLESHMVSYSTVREGEDGSSSFIRILLLHGRVIGAILIGQTGLEEALENLILDKLDVSAYGGELLDPDFELDHVFD